MRRRHLLTMLGSAAVAGRVGLRSASAQLARPAHIGFIGPGHAPASKDFLDGFREGLEARGYADPMSVKLELLYAENALDRVPALVSELEARRVEVIVTHAAATRPVVTAPRATPVVYQFSADPVGAGLAPDLAHPGFNATGITLLMADVNVKRMELLREVIPGIRRVAVLGNSLHPGEQRERAVAADIARRLGLEINYLPFTNREELGRALDALQANPPEGVILFTDGFMVANRHRVFEVTMSRRIPVVSGWTLMAESGALFTYGPRQRDAYARVAHFVDRILKGAKPAELPIEQPSVLELIVNLDAARRLGIEIPATLLARADRVLE